MNSFMRSVLCVVVVLFGLGLVLYSAPAEATSKGCESECNAVCNDLPKAERKECRQKCFVGKCGNRGVMQKARKLGLIGVLCEGDGECNAYCEEGPVADIDCNDGEPLPFLRVSIPESVPAYSFFSMTVTVLGEDGEPDVGYGGTIHFETEDVGAQLPMDYMFMPSDNGTHVFPGIRLTQEGAQDIVISEVQEGAGAVAAAGATEDGRSAVVTIIITPRAPLPTFPRF